MMALTNTVISGSWALLAIFPDSFIPGDLDFYTAKSQSNNYGLFIPFLESRGYRIVSFADANYGPGPEPENFPENTEIEFIFKLSNGTTFINVVFSQSQSGLQPIFEFHSTVVMNYIAWYGVVCLYPGLTLKRRGLINHHVLPSRVAACIEKYRSRGFDLQPSLGIWNSTRAHICEEDPNCPNSRRHILSPSVFFVTFREGFSLEDFEDDIEWKLRINCIP